MRYFVLILSTIAFAFTVTVSVAHACVDVPQDITADSVSHAHSDIEDNEQKSSCDCDMMCGHGCVHHHVISYDEGASLLLSQGYKGNKIGESQVVLSDFVYGLKRPPKS
ncbi:MAG: hypothetical protein ACRBB3_09000 [Alphaproteobacteria bacterium]